MNGQVNTLQPQAVAALWNTKVISQEDIQTLRQTIAADCSDSMFKLFLLTCDRTGLDPISRQIFPVVRQASKNVNGSWIKVPVLTIQTGIDGFRVIAQRSGEYLGQTKPEWCGPDGKWVEVWLKPTPPAAARVGIYRKGFLEPIWGIATYQSYVQTDSGGKPSGLWAKMSDNQLLKCAEAQAHRKAFPNDLSGIYEPAEGASEPIDITPEGHPTVHVLKQGDDQQEQGEVDPEILALCLRLNAAFRAAGAPDADAEVITEKWKQHLTNGSKTLADFETLIISAEKKAEKKAQQSQNPLVGEVVAAEVVAAPDLTDQIAAAWLDIDKTLQGYCRTKKEIANVKAEMLRTWVAVDAAHATPEVNATWLLDQQLAWLTAPVFPFPAEQKSEA